MQGFKTHISIISSWENSRTSCSNNIRGPLKDVNASNQYAYWPKLSTTDAIRQLLDDATANLDLIESKYVQ